MKRRKIKEVTKQHVLLALDNERRIFDTLYSRPVNRSFPRQDDLNLPALEALQHVLQNGSILLNHDDEGIELCYQRGWLHSEEIQDATSKAVCVFPSRLHEKYFPFHYMRIV
jgi:hypothetical protein